MEKKKLKLGLFPKLIIAIIIGILFGQFLPVWFCRIVVTLSSIFSTFLSFIIPLMILAYVCRVWCVQVTGWKPATVADTALVQIEHGPAKGIWADEKAADMQECLYEALQPFAGQAVLQAIGEQNGLGFLMADGTLTVAQASVISGTDSDPRFTLYYTLLPEKLPAVVLYDDAEVRDMDAFHAWIEENFAVTGRYTVTHGTASLQVLTIGGWAG